jgi:predicted Fe-Mo cluster-binding NifX family protein
MDAQMGRRFGLSPYFVIIDSATKAVETVPNPGGHGGRGAGVQAVVLAISKGVDVVLTGYCSPMAEKHLTDQGIRVVAGVEGTVGGAVARYLSGELVASGSVETRTGPGFARPGGAVLVRACKSSARQFVGLLPILVSVILLIGLFNAFVSRELLSGIFSGHAVLDTLWGACFGSVIAGNPINSYIIGGELLDYGVSLFAVTALVISWVSVGLIQLPAEMVALGKKFAVVRTAASFVMAVIIAMATVTMVNFFVR